VSSGINITAPLNGSAVIELSFRSNKDTEPVVISGQVAIVKHAKIRASINGPAFHSYQLQTKTTDFVDKFLKTAMSAEAPQVNTRLGVSAGGNTGFYLPPQNHTVTSYQAIPHQDGHTIHLETADMMFEISKADNKVHLWHGRISEIVEEIAKKNGLKAVVEPTRKTSESYIQSNIDDISFILKRLVPRALNDKGRGSYRLFLRDNALHFHTPDFQANLYLLNYFNGSPAGMLRVADRTQLASRRGAGGVIGIVYDPITGETTVTEEDPSKTLNYAKVTPKLTTPSNPITYHLGSNRLDELKAIVQNHYEQPYMGMYEAMLELHQVPSVQLNDLVNLVIQPGQVLSPWSGLYSVVELVHDVEDGALRSVFKLQRGELEAAGQAFKDLDNGLNVQENFATGQAINLANVKSSGVTQGGAERLPGGELLKPVQSPN
jgi:hypothetical protein